MTRPAESDPRDAILEVVVRLLETEGYDAVQLREVARRAHVSLATIYKLFSGREQLIFAALERWRADHVYLGLDDAETVETTADGLMRVFRSMFEPWERNPLLLEAFHRVGVGPRGARLTEDGTDVVRPAVRALFADEDPAYVDDVLLILRHVVYGAVGRFVDGELEVTEILPVIEVAVTRLTTPEPRRSRAAPRHRQ